MRTSHPRLFRTFVAIAGGILLFLLSALLVTAQTAAKPALVMEPQPVTGEGESPGAPVAPDVAARIAPQPARAEQLAPSLAPFTGTVPVYPLPLIEVQVNDVVTGWERAPAIAAGEDGTLYTV
jgi:hypothetical protein